jgi:nucleoside phosphorylase
MGYCKTQNLEGIGIRSRARRVIGPDTFPLWKVASFGVFSFTMCRRAAKLVRYIVGARLSSVFPVCVCARLMVPSPARQGTVRRKDFCCGSSAPSEFVTARPRHHTSRAFDHDQIDRPSMRRLNAEDYTIGWISPLSTELAASMAMLDEEHLALPTTPSDHNIYTLGRVGQHNIVMAGLPAGLLGPSSAASVAAKMRTSFPWIRFGLLVGIAGGAPSPDKDVRLGDVVVSQPMEQSGGVVQFDSGTIVEGKLVRSGSLNAPPTILLSAITWLTAKHMSKTNDFVRHLNTVLDAVHSDFTYPNVEDQLFESSYEHEGGDTCVNCDIRRLVPRIPRPNPTVHYGLIASANRVIQDGLERDKLGKEFNVLCFEMEAAGLMNEFPCIVIRGISDYADSHKNEIWQRYAATTAAVYAKELLCTIAERVPNSTMLRQDPNQGVSISLGERPYDKIKSSHSPLQTVANAV